MTSRRSARLILWRHRLTHPSHWRVRLEWKPADCWVGVFWKSHPWNTRLDVWVCVVPMVPIHLIWLAQGSAGHQALADEATNG